MVFAQTFTYYLPLQMSDASAALDWEELPEAEEPLGKRQLLMCPADNCQDMGSYEHLCEHWSRIHHAYTLLYLCPFQGWGCKKMMKPDIRQHAQEQHQLSRDSLLVFDTVPAVVQVVPTRNYKYPGDHSPLTSTPEVPEGTFRFQDKIRASVLLQEKLIALQVNHATSSTQPPPSAPRPSASTANAPPSAVLGLPRQSEGSSAVRSATSPPATSSRKVVDRNASMEQLELHLRQIRHREVTLWQERDNVLHRLENRSNEEIAQLRQGVQALRQRMVFLEGENRRLLKPDREPRPVIVGHLESIPSSRALVLYPTSGHTSVYPLDGQDICLLDLPNRTPCLSSDAL